MLPPSVHLVGLDRNGHRIHGSYLDGPEHSENAALVYRAHPALLSAGSVLTPDKDLAACHEITNHSDDNRVGS